MPWVISEPCSLKNAITVKLDIQCLTYNLLYYKLFESNSNKWFNIYLLLE